MLETPRKPSGGREAGTGFMRPPPLRLSLSGAGFLGSYHLGVGRALQRSGRLEQPATEVAGASAGAIVGAVLVSETPMEAARASLQALVAHTLAAPLGVLTPGFSLVDAVRAELSARLPSDAHRSASGRLHIALTSLRPGELGRIHYKSAFGSRDELIDAVSASSDIPGFTGRLRAGAPSNRGGGPVAGGQTDRQTVWQRLTGKSDVDGGLFDIFPDPWRGQLPPTTFVSPFAGVGFAIAPHRTPGSPLVPTWSPLQSTVPGTGRTVELSARNAGRWRDAFFPPSNAAVLRYEDEGFEAAAAWLGAEEARSSGEATGPATAAVHSEA